MPIIYTIGHSTRSIDEFVALLQLHGIEQLVDIRTIPKSRHNPQYEQHALAASLAEHGIEYTYLMSLGGLRSGTKESVNDAWRSKSFRNYADYMQTAAFTTGIDELVALSAGKTTAIMCAEAVPWRCHCSLVSDALLVRGIESCEIIGAKSMRPHTMTSFAVVDGITITYPKSALQESEGDQA